MNIDEEKQRYANQIVNALSGSPAINKEQANNISIPEQKNPVDQIVETITDDRPVPTVGIGSVLGLPGQAKLQAKMAKAEQLVDTSTGVNIEDTGSAEQKIATTRTLGINGPQDIEQREYGLDEQSMAAASSGTNEGDLHTINLRAGNAGLNISTDSTLNPEDGSDGNPAFFNSKYPLLQTKVMPFKVKIPAYNMEVVSETLDPDKLAYQVATMIAGRPIPTYIGYTNAGFDLTESWYSGAIKGAMNAPAYLADIGVKGGAYVGTVSNYRQALRESVYDVVFRGKTMDEADERLKQNLENVAKVTDETLHGWNKIVDGYKDFLGTDLTEYAGFWTRFAEAAPTALAQMGAAYGINVLAAGAGVSPQASRLLAAVLSGATYGTAQGGDTFAGLEGAAISPTHRMANATASAAGSTLLNSLGYLAIFGSKMAAVRKYATNYTKRLWGAGAAAGLKGFVSEGLTEVGDQVLQDALTYNMGDDTIAQRFDNYTMAFLLGGITGLMGIRSAVSAERMQIYEEQIKAGTLAKDAQPALLALNDAVTKMANTGLLTREQAFDFIKSMATAEGQRGLENKQGEILMGLMDKLNPDAVKYAKSLSKTELQQVEKDFETLDRTVTKALPKELDDNTKTMVSRAMFAIAPLIAYYNNGRFNMPKFRIRDGSPMAYDEKTNTIYINTKSSGEPIDLGLVKNKNTPLIDPVQRGILHELGHFLDYQLQRGTNFKEFMPTYFEAIARAYGKERADAVQKSMNKKGDTFAFAKSDTKADVKEKQADKVAGRINVKNTTENFAYAIGRLGKKVGKALGMGDSDVAQHIDAIMLMATSLRIPSIQKQLNAYQKALTELIKKNDETLRGMAKAQGNEELARKIQDFVAGDTNALSKEDVLALYNILKTYTGVDGAKIIDEAFEGTKPETFMQRVEREFGESIKESGTTVGQVQDAIAKRNTEAKQETKKGNDNIDENDLPNFDLNEQIAYASTRGPLEGGHLDADRYYATGEARGVEGRAMRWGYGNYLNKSPDINKKYYFDMFLREASKKLDSKLVDKDGKKIQYDSALDDIFAWLETFGKEDEDVRFTKADIDKKLSDEVQDAQKAYSSNTKLLVSAMDDVIKDKEVKHYLSEYIKDKYPNAKPEDVLRNAFYEIRSYEQRFAKGHSVPVLVAQALRAFEYNKAVQDYDIITLNWNDAVSRESQATADLKRFRNAGLPEDAVLIVGKRDVKKPEQHAFMIPDNEYFLDALKPISQQTKFIKDRINKIADKYDYWNSDYVLNPNSGAYDIDIMDLNGEEVYHWLADNAAYMMGFEKIVDRYRFATNALSDTGIKGMHVIGQRDDETFNVFRSEDNTQYRQLHEDVFDVSTVLNSNKKYVSNLEKRTDAKPDGKTYADDIKEVKGIIASAGKTPSWFAKFFANGDLNMGLWSIGGKKLVEHFDLIGKMNRSSNAATDFLMEFDGKMKKAMGFKNNIQRDTFENNASINNITLDYVIDPLTDDVIGTKISPLVAMNLYNTAKSKIGYQKVLNTFGGDVNGMNKAINSLTPEQKKYADLMMDYVKEKWSYYNKSYEQEGVQLDNEPYWPIADAVHIALGDRKINSDFARNKNKDGMISLDVDAREVFNHYVQRMGGAKENVYATIQRMKDIFGYEKVTGDDQPTEDYMKLSNEMWENSKKIRGMSQSNIGGDAKYDRFLSLLDDFLNKHEAQIVGTESLNIAARNLTSGLLQWKPIQFMKNLANASGYWGLADNQAQYWSDTAWAATHPTEAARYMFEKVPYIRNRFKGQDYDEALTQQTAGQDSLVMNWAKNAKNLSPEAQKIISNLVALTQASRRLGFTPMLSGDMSANVVGGYGLLKQYEAKYGDRAGDKLSEDIVMHQASSIQATRSLLQRQWSRGIQGELLRFSSEGVQKGKSIGLAIAQAARGERSAGSATKEVLSTLSSMILFALISAGVIDLFDNNEENDKEVYEALTREGISAVMGFSVIGNSIITPIVSMPLTGEMSTMGTPLTNIVSADLKKLHKGDWEDLVIDSIGATVPIVGLDNLINLTRAPGRLLDEDERVRNSGLYMLSGRTENYAEKRSGLK